MYKKTGGNFRFGNERAGQYFDCKPETNSFSELIMTSFLDQVHHVMNKEALDALKK